MVKPELDKSRDYYGTLGISYQSTQVDIRKAFLELARTQHPDKNPGQEQLFKAKFQEITLAYDVLKDPASKKTYDQVRPVQRKPVVPKTPVNSTNTTRPFTTKPQTPHTSARAAFEASTRAHGVPRQAKTAPRPAGQRAPYSNATSPLPRGPNGTGQAPSVPPFQTFAQYQASARGKPAGPANASPNPKSFGSKGRAPTAAQSAFFHASPSSPRQKSTNSSPMAGERQSTDARSRPGPSAPKAPTTPLTSGWWGQSGTAYSTFHAPSSKYSPYAEEPFRKSDHRRSTDKKSDTPKSQDHEKTSDHLGMDGETPEQYQWQNSSSAYQRTPVPKQDTNERDERQTSRKKKKNSFPDSTTTENSFCRGRRGLDSDRIDRFSDDSLSGVTSVSSGSESSSTDEADGRDTLRKASEDAFSSPELKQREAELPPAGAKPFGERPILTPQGFKKFHKSFTTPLASTPETASNSSAPQSRPQAETGIETHRFSFNFRPCPETLTANRRKSSSSVPFVKFNAVPDLDFSSPSGYVQSDSACRPFSSASHIGRTPRVADDKGHRVDEKVTESQLNGALDRKGGETTEPESATKDTFPITFATLNLGTRSSTKDSVSNEATLGSSPFSSNEQQSASHSPNPSPVSSINRQAIGLASPTKIERKGSPLRPASESFRDRSIATIPVIPQQLYRPVVGNSSPSVYCSSYLHYSREYNRYQTAWLEFQSNILQDVTTAEGLIQVETKYVDALEAHRIVSEVHDKVERQHAVFVEKLVRS